MQEHYKGALKLLLCYPYKEDNKATKLFKKYCLDNWGKWDKCAPLASRDYEKIIRLMIAHPKNYREAIKSIDREMLNIYLLAYQSYIFNECLKLYVIESGMDNVEVPYIGGTLLFYSKLKRENNLQNMEIPMLNEKTKLGKTDSDKIKRVLAEEGIELKQFALHKMRFRGVRFKTFLRRAIVYPKNLVIGELEDDELYKEKKKIRFSFQLPPGSYATILIKRLLI